MSSVRARLRPVTRRAARLRGKVAVRRAARDTTGVATRRALRSIQRSFDAEVSEAEAAWAVRIEARRALLAASSDRITMTDFGAGRHAEHDGTTDAVHVDERTVAEMAEVSASPPRAAFLYKLAVSLRASSVLELGSCVGISASYLAAGLRDGATGGRLITLEGSEALAALASETLSGLGLDDVATVRIGPFADTLAGAIDALRPIDLAFIDGHHEHEATLRYMEQILPHTTDEAVLVFDDIGWSAGMRAAWASIEGDPRFAATIDMGSSGLAIISRSESRTFRIPHL